MPQDKESGAKANEYGRETAKKIWDNIDAKSISKISNEFELQDRRITIHCARHSTNDIGISFRMLERIDDIFAALEQENGEYKLYKISPSMFEENMRETKSKGNAAGKVGLVRKSVFVKEGQFIRSVKI